jgi:L-ascorbate metabolism protein UlaG (beta-lactamase superfamily)
MKTINFFIILTIAGILIPACSPLSQTQEEQKKRFQSSPQYKDGSFANPNKVPLIAPGSTWKLIKKYTVIPRQSPKPTGRLSTEPLRAEDWTGLKTGGLFFSWLGHSSLLIALEGKTILVDPVLEERASPFSWIGPKRFHPSPLALKDLFPVDVVLITHDHYDHLEKSTIKKLAGKANLFLVPLGNAELLEKWGIPPRKIIELDWWGQHKLGTLKFSATPAIHYSGRSLFNKNKRLWCSWSVQGLNRNIFISGDSGFFEGFKEIGQKAGPFDMTFLKIGSYDETWKQIHMTPEEAVRQHLDLRGRVLVPIHWATFDLALHPWFEPMERLVTAAKENEVQFIIPKIGQRINADRLPEMEFWWRNIDKPRK